MGVVFMNGYDEGIKVISTFLPIPKLQFVGNQGNLHLVGANSMTIEDVDKDQSIKNHHKRTVVTEIKNKDYGGTNRFKIDSWVRSK